MRRRKQPNARRITLRLPSPRRVPGEGHQYCLLFLPSTACLHSSENDSLTKSNPWADRHKTTDTEVQCPRFPTQDSLKQECLIPRRLASTKVRSCFREWMRFSFPRLTAHLSSRETSRSHSKRSEPFTQRRNHVPSDFSGSTSTTCFIQPLYA